MRRFQAILPILFLAVTTSGCCCLNGINAAREAARDTQSRNNMMQICLGAIMYQDANGEWPNTLDDIRGQVPDLDTVMTNPVTMDHPGYEYVKPADDAEWSQTVILYQLRNGQRDTSMPKGYMDGSVRN